jgi:hypothetical protein
MSDAARTIALAGIALALTCAWAAWRALRDASISADRLVAELRLAQLAALLLAFVAAPYVGFAAVQPHQPIAALHVSLALGFFVVAAIGFSLEPRRALTVLAIAFGAHALLDTLHRPDLLADGLAPRWYLVGCAIHNVAIGILCYLPVLRR